MRKHSQIHASGRRGFLIDGVIRRVILPLFIMFIGKIQIISIRRERAALRQKTSSTAYELERIVISQSQTRLSFRQV
ncbi:hypothetical protein FGO68_gene16796 [Halteria grandinella]|uniref:Uncharacterized protein n=1 Tax=Halteria grandinella TaxID=5974 RepID=A0A8J8NAB2_HALGN|nr:hypothetical protein FGO68_gene16796 [Halteria grandinella]